MPYHGHRGNGPPTLNLTTLIDVYELPSARIGEKRDSFQRLFIPPPSPVWPTFIRYLPVHRAARISMIRMPTIHTM